MGIHVSQDSVKYIVLFLFTFTLRAWVGEILFLWLIASYDKTHAEAEFLKPNSIFAVTSFQLFTQHCAWCYNRSTDYFLHGRIN